MRIRTLGKFFAAAVLALAYAAPAAAQSTGTSGVLVGAGVSFVNTDVDDQSETFTGFSVDARKNVYSAASFDLGVVGDFGWHRKSLDDVDPFDIKLTLMSFMGGVRLTASKIDRVAPFAQFLVGGVRGTVSGDFSCDDFDEEDGACETDGAIAIGGGVDVKVTPTFNIRGQVDYFRVFTEVEGTNAFRFLIGASFLLGGS